MTRSETAIAHRAVVDLAWRGVPPPDLGERGLAKAVAFATRNQVQGVLARAYRDRLREVDTEVGDMTAVFVRNLVTVIGRLEAAAVEPVLIKLAPGGDHVYSNFDLVVGDRWRESLDALSGWYRRESRHALEPDKLLLHPVDGPAAHLHQSVSWFGVPVIEAERLRDRAIVGATGLREPCAADALRVWLAHAAFQNLAFDISELLAVRNLLQEEVVAEASNLARAEGWYAAYCHTLKLARAAIDALDNGRPTAMPVPLTAATSLAVVREHPRHLLNTGRGQAARREVMIRLPLAVMKRTRLVLS